MHTVNFNRIPEYADTKTSFTPVPHAFQGQINAFDFNFIPLFKLYKQ